MYTAPGAPQSIGGVIDNAIELFKASFRRCWIAALVYAVVLGVIGTWMQMRMLSAFGSVPPTSPAAVLAAYQSPAFGIGSLLVTLLGLAFSLVLIVTTLDVARGREGGDAMTRFGTVLPWLPGAVVAALVMMIACIVGFVLLVIPGLYLLFRWFLWTVALSDERRGAFAALGTSWRLVGGHWWRTFTVMMVAGVVVMIVTLIFGFIGGLLAGLLDVDLTTRLMLSQAFSAVGQVLYLPAVTATVVAVYLDLKLRKDGADLEARLGALGTSRA